MGGVTAGVRGDQLSREYPAREGAARVLMIESHAKARVGGAGLRAGASPPACVSAGPTK